MQYERYILMILAEAGPVGMPVRRIALNVYNITNSLFAPLCLEKVYADVAEWLRSESQKSGGTVRKADIRGWYRLNEQSTKVEQLMLEFIPEY